MDEAERERLRSHVFDRENDGYADAQFPWKQMTPEEWVARHSHRVGCFSLHRFRYRNAELGQWMRRLGELLTSGEHALDGYRKQYLSPTEYNRVRKEIATQEW